MFLFRNLLSRRHGYHAFSVDVIAALFVPAFGCAAYRLRSAIATPGRRFSMVRTDFGMRRYLRRVSRK
jgi:hypothetical protein